MIEAEDEVEISEGDTVVRAYGLYWQRNAVHWASKQLLGNRRKYKKTSKTPNRKEKDCNAWNVQGIYALYADFRLIYVGMTGSSQGIGERLSSHDAKPRLQGRWDSFSWFGIDAFDTNGNLKPYLPHPITAVTLVRTLELVSILIAAPLMNRAEGRFKNAEQIIQDVRDSPKKPEELIADLTAEIKLLNTAVRKLSAS